MSRAAVLALLVGLWACGGIRPPGPQPTPTPTPPTTTTTSTTTSTTTTTTLAPIPKVCPLTLPLPAVYSIGIRVEGHGTSGQQFDSTPFVKRSGDAPFPPVGWTGSCRVNQCDLSAEKDPEHGNVCAAELCGTRPAYTFEPEDAAIINWQDGYVVKVTASKAGFIRTTCPRSAATATAAIP